MNNYNHSITFIKDLVKSMLFRKMLIQAFKKTFSNVGADLLAIRNIKPDYLTVSANVFLNAWINIFLNNVDFTRSLIEESLIEDTRSVIDIMLRLVIYAQKICPVLFHLTIKNY